MSRDLGGGVVTDDLPEDTSQPVNVTQWPFGSPFQPINPCDPAAIHDLYPPVGTRPGEFLPPPCTK